MAATDFTRFDHILAMDRANLAELERRASGGRARVGLFMAYAPGQGDEVPDPYYGGVEDFERVVDLCEAAARGLMAALSRPE